MPAVTPRPTPAEVINRVWPVRNSETILGALYAAGYRIVHRDDEADQAHHIHGGPNEGDAA